LKLAIEIDGSSHNNTERYNTDMERQKALEALGVRFLRFNDIDVKKNMNDVLRVLQIWIEQNKPK
jgi:very-short-patch-repair endonuclease